MEQDPNRPDFESVPPTGGETPPPPPPESTPPGGTPPPTPNGAAPASEERTIAMLAHLLGILIWILGPLIIWLIKKDESAFVDDQGKEALNFQITLTIGYAIGMITACIGIGVIISLVVWVLAIVFGILASVASYHGERYRYPINIRLIK